MNLAENLERIVTALDSKDIRYALIGGMAMAMRGIQRATLDLDFILLLNDLDETNRILEGHGYRRAFHSENVSHYIGSSADLGRIDILHAFRSASLGMLDRAERLPWPAGICVPVAQTEDLIGLKLQACVNDPTRQPRDWSDILRMVTHAKEQSVHLDWNLLADYFSLFDLDSKLEELARLYGRTY